MSEEKVLKRRERISFVFKTIILFFFLYDVVFAGIPTTYSTRKISFVAILMWALVLLIFGQVKKDLFEYPAFRNVYIALAVVTAISVPYTIYRAEFYGVLDTKAVEYPHAVFFIIYSLIAPVLTAIMFKSREEFQRSVMFVTLVQSLITLAEYKIAPFRQMLARFVDDSSANVRYDNFDSVARATGLGVSGSMTAVMLALGTFVIGQYIIAQMGRIKWLWFCWVVFAVAMLAEFFSGKTGFYMSIVALVILLIRVLMKSDEPGKVWKIIGITFGSAGVVFSLWYAFFGRHIHLVRERFRHYFNLTVEFGSGKTSFWTRFTGGEVPPLSLDVVFGLGIFKGTTNTGLTMTHDSGYLRRLVADGIPLAALEYILLLWVILLLLRQIDRLQTKVYYGLMVLVIFLIEIKEPYIYKYMPIYFVMTLGLLERSYYLEDDAPIFSVNKRKSSAWVAMGLKFKKAKRGIKYSSLIKDNEKAIKAMFDRENRNLKGKFLTLDDRQKLLNAFLGFNRYKPEEAAVIAEHFLGENVKIAKTAYEPLRIPADEPILMCNVRDDLEKIKNVIGHHRSMGVKYFAILDNGSVDGTLEYLMSEDIDVFTVEEQYTSVVRAAWMMKLAAYYGFDRWYVVIDSDELLVNPGGKEQDIHTIISDMKARNLQRARGMMVDMYAESSDLRAEASEESILNTHRFFDKDTYSKKGGTFCPEITGGPRVRVFPQEKNDAPELLTKYPVFYWKKGEIYRYHYLYPFEYNFASPNFLVLLHYKFVDGDLEKIERIVKEGNYAGGSRLYGRYLEKLPPDGKISFKTERSAELTQPSDLLAINVIEKL